MQPRILFGEGALDHLPELLRRSQGDRVLLLASAGTMQVGRLRKSPQELLSRFDVRIFSDFKPVPKLGDLRAALKMAAERPPDAIVGLGGGTAMDLAKLTALLACQPDPDPEPFLRGQRSIASPRTCLLILVPTTSGTGSEVTQFAVLYIGKQKYSLDHPYILADYALVDPSLTWSMPPQLTASTGMDVISQAIESYWSVRSTETSRDRAVDAIRLAAANLVAACRNPTRLVRERMSLAALWAGEAINITRTTAAHAASYPLTAYFGIPHGHACALTLPHFLGYNANVTDNDALDPRGVAFVRARIQEIAQTLGRATPEAGRTWLTELTSSIGLAPRLGALGVPPEAVDLIVEQGVNPERAANNPRRVAKQALRDLLLEIL